MKECKAEKQNCTEKSTNKKQAFGIKLGRLFLLTFCKMYFIIITLY